jgi:hypothetical protein
MRGAWRLAAATGRRSRAGPTAAHAHGSEMQLGRCEAYRAWHLQGRRVGVVPGRPSDPAASGQM